MSPNYSSNTPNRHLLFSPLLTFENFIDYFTFVLMWISVVCHYCP